MGWLDRLRRAFRRESPSPPQRPASPPTRSDARPSAVGAPEPARPAEPLPDPLVADPQVAAWQEWAAERLLEDETLRRDLTDEEFQPILDRALAIVDRVAAETAGQSDEAARLRLEATLDRIRRTIRAGRDLRDGAF
jgi:hypothetical protein